MSQKQDNHSNNLLEKATLLYNNRNLKEAQAVVEEVKNLCALNGDQKGLIRSNLLLSSIYDTSGRYLGDSKKIQQAQTFIRAAETLTSKDFPRQQLSVQLALAQAYQSERAFDSAARHFKQLLKESTEQQENDFQIRALIGLSEYATFQNEFDQALAHARTAEDLLSVGNTKQSVDLVAIVYNQLSQIHFKQQEYDEMLSCSEKVLQLSAKNGDIEKELNALKNIAIYHAAKSDYKKAMQYFLDSMDKSRAINYRYHTAQCLINIATIYANLYNHKDAIARYQIVLEEYSDIISKNTRIVIYNNLGNIYYFSDRFSQAANFFEKAHKLAKQRNYTEMIILSLVNLSRTNIAKNEVTIADQQAKEAEALMKSQGDINGRQINLLNLGHIDYLRGDFEKAMLLTSKGIATSKQMQDEANEVRGYQLMSNIHQLQGNYKTALDFQLVYSKAQDKFAKEQRHRQIIDLEIKNAIKEKQKEIEQLTRENEYQALLLKQNEQISIQNAQLLAANQELRQFAYVTSHDLKEPIRMIGSYTQLIERKHHHQFTEDSQLYFTYVKEGVIRMNDLLDALLKYTTISKTEDAFEAVSLMDIVEIAVIHLRVTVDENKAVINCQDLPEVMSIKSLLIQLFQNLISNAIKFKKENTAPQIDISATTTAEEVVIQVKDNGIGIAAEYQERIFVIFQRLHTRTEYDGTGIGLAICQKIVQRLGGRIWVASDFGAGASFFVALPRTKKIN